MLRRLLLAAVLFSGARPLHAQRALPTLDSMALRGHTWFMSHDLLEGRDTGSRGAEVAARYLAASAERLGLIPVPGAGGWYQDVPLADAEIDTSATQLVLT